MGFFDINGNIISHDEIEKYCLEFEKIEHREKFGEELPDRSVTLFMIVYCASNLWKCFDETLDDITRGKDERNRMELVFKWLKEKTGLESFKFNKD